ncbi:MAG: hypothetical protein DSM106950_16935 [Stigonema ocellatum SAG 48.90 = DSM 106950]|nr:hypothetical protein [Stigonema ocellatum SAG 48.90 = DSM 106950]
MSQIYLYDSFDEALGLLHPVTHLPIEVSLKDRSGGLSTSIFVCLPDF